MKNKSLILIGSLLMVLFATGIVVSCNKKFDEPPAISTNVTDTSILNNIITIKALKSRHTISGLEQITDNAVITGIVGGSDESGNLYKEITIQDSTGGITILLDRSGLYTDYPLGRRIYVKCNGLYISDYQHGIQLGSLNNTVPTNPAITAIPSSLFDNYIVKGTLGNTITPKIVTLDQLNTIAGISASKIPTQDTLQSTLVQLNNVELATTDTGLIYADTSAAKKSVGRNITDCIGTTGVVLYSSGYATFAGFTPPSGKGSILGIYTPYKTTAEIEVRDTSDVHLFGSRCGASTPTTLFSESFPGITNKVPITTTGSGNVWQNIAEIGTTSYMGYVNTSGSIKEASISGYVSGGNPPAVTSWLITQGITIPASTNSPILTFVSNDACYGKKNQDVASFQVLVSTDYNGSSTPSKSTWTVLPASIPSGDSTFLSKAQPSGSIDLSNYIGKTIFLGWRYTATNSVQAGSKFEFGTVQVVGY